MSTNFLSRSFHKFHPARFIFGLLEVKCITLWLYSVNQGISEVGGIFWREIGCFFILELLGCKILCFWKMKLVEDIATYAKREMRPKPWV